MTFSNRRFSRRSSIPTEATLALPIKVANPTLPAREARKRARAVMLDIQATLGGYLHPKFKFINQISTVSSDQVTATPTLAKVVNSQTSNSKCISSSSRHQIIPTDKNNQVFPTIMLIAIGMKATRSIRCMAIRLLKEDR